MPEQFPQSFRIRLATARKAAWPTRHGQATTQSAATGPGEARIRFCFLRVTPHAKKLQIAQTRVASNCEKNDVVRWIADLKRRAADGTQPALF